MVKYENECVGCTTMGLPCRGSACPLQRVPHYYCDECGAEEDIYEFEGEELCIDCIERRLTKINP